MKKIPDHAKKVFEGVLHDVYHWEQEMFDGSFSTFEALKRRDGVTIIAVTDDSKIIINDERQPMTEPFISFPGGDTESDIFLEDAQRELLEETGYTSDSWELLSHHDILKYHKLEWNNNIFIARHCKKVAEQNLGRGERIQTRCVTYEEMLELRHNPMFRNKDVVPLLEKAAEHQEEKQVLQELLGISP